MPESSSSSASEAGSGAERKKGVQRSASNREHAGRARRAYGALQTPRAREPERTQGGGARDGEGERPPFNARKASAQCRELTGYVSFASVEGLGAPPSGCVCRCSPPTSPAQSPSPRSSASSPEEHCPRCCACEDADAGARRGPKRAGAGLRGLKGLLQELYFW